MVDTLDTPNVIEEDREEGAQRAPAGRRGVAIGTAVLLLLGALLLMRLGALERGGPPHVDVSIGDGIPATLYLPGEDGADFPDYEQDEADRPPLIVIAHGYSADRKIMSPMARSLAKAGYATLAFDFRGHGDNTATFKGDLRDDLEAVLDWAETQPNFDSSRVAVLGHSMGAGAALAFATTDDRPVAVVPVSGGWGVQDTRLPPNVFLIAASGDPARILDAQQDVARDIRGRTNVRTSVVGGKDHATILYSNTAIREIDDFLAPVLEPERPQGAARGLVDPRGGTVFLYFLVALGLIALLGRAVGRFVTPLPSTAMRGGILLVAGALLVTTPLMALGGPTILPIGAGQPVIVGSALAAALLWTLRLGAQRGVITGGIATWIGDGPWLPLRQVALPGVAAGLVVFVLLSPIGVVFHRMVPTTQRLVLWVLASALALPFFAAFEALVRRGSTWSAIGWGALGRVVLLAMLLVGLGLQTLPGVIALVIPLLILQYVILEIFAATAYASGRNVAVIAVVDAIFIGWMATTLTPIG